MKSTFENMRPFDNCTAIRISLPKKEEGLESSERDQVKGIQKLLEEHRYIIEKELGSSFYFSEGSPPQSEGHWIIGPYRCNPLISKMGYKEPPGPQIILDRKKNLLITHGKTPSEVTETYSYLRSLSHFQGEIWDISDCKSVDQAIERIRNEVANSYPAFKLKNINWDKLCKDRIPDVVKARDPIPEMQKWLAQLSDSHTWVRPAPAFAELPYDLHVFNGLGTFYNVPENSKAFELGVRRGCRLLCENYDEWWERTAASSHSKPWVVGKRILSSPRDIPRILRVELANKKIVEWEETPLVDRWDPAVYHKLLSPTVGYLKVKAWMLGKGVEESIDEAFDDFKKCSALIVDLRSSPGGNLLMAHRFRNRFLKSEGVVGYIQSTFPDGSLSERRPINGEMVENKKRWHAKVVFLTDALTYSASEDVILGLQGQPHVKVVGSPSGGGSGRARVLRLLPNYILTVSTSLTYDLNGHCVEGAGLPVDINVPTDISANGPDLVLEKALSLF